MSDKRKKEVSQYVQLRNSFIEQERAKNKGKLVCLFCGEMIHGDPDLHHMIGRDNEKLLQIRFWHLAHRKCHSEWHDKIFEELLWGKEYKERVMRYNLVAHQIIWRFN